MALRRPGRDGSRLRLRGGGGPRRTGRGARPGSDRPDPRPPHPGGRPPRRLRDVATWLGRWGRRRRVACRIPARAVPRADVLGPPGGRSVALPADLAGIALTRGHGSGCHATPARGSLAVLDET